MALRGHGVKPTARCSAEHSGVLQVRVWLINHYALPPSEPGGTRHYALARELIRSGHDVTIIASSFNHATGMQMNCAHEKLCTFESLGEVPFLLLRVPPYRSKMARVWNM